MLIWTMYKISFKIMFDKRKIKYRLYTTFSTLSLSLFFFLFSLHSFVVQTTEINCHRIFLG